MWWRISATVPFVAASYIVWENTTWQTWLLVGLLLSLSHILEGLRST